ncbi:MAG: pyruvate kinase [Planctomycetota bacterium]
MNDNASPTAYRRTKIVATLGPQTCTSESVGALLRCGVDMARINASHGDHAGHASLIKIVREEAAKLGRPVGVLYDLQGPKIRIGEFDGDPIPVQLGDEFALAVGRPPTGDEIPADYPLLDQDVSVGAPLLIDDGQLACEVIAVERGLVRCKALNDGAIAQRKGINLPASPVSAPSVTQKDRRDVLFAVEQNVDAIALSFVRRRSDVDELRDFLADHGADMPLIAKIEKPQALDNLEEILEASWGVMVARGDLGVELSPEEVPMAQKRIIQEAGRLCKPVITATQMLDSMTRNPRPTRAEASDVANAVLDHTDAVMLSGETAVGKYPTESVEMMVRIIARTEDFLSPTPVLRRRERSIDSVPAAVADAGCQVAHHLDARAIVAFTRTGTTALLAARRRPTTPIFAFSPGRQVCNLLCMVWGVQSFEFDPVDTSDQLILDLNRRLVTDHSAEPGDLVVILMGAPTDAPGHTNRMILRRVGEDDHLG